MQEKFIDWKPRGKTLGLLAIIGNILVSYQQQGYRLTLRQLYYQLVAGGHIANSVRVYKQIGDIVSNARLAGDIDWEMIEDRVRIPQINTHWTNPKQIMDAAIKSYYKSRWERQPGYIEVWCEKDAVSNIIEPICRRWDVVFIANRGYSSQSAMYDGYQRFARHGERTDLAIIYLGDHDPSGWDMVNDIRNRMRIFFGGFESVEVKRIALNKPQIKKYNPPENPAKTTDSRYAAYLAQYGHKSWELDALEPKVLSSIVEDAILEHLDRERWEEVCAEEEREKEKLRVLAEKL